MIFLANTMLLYVWFRMVMWLMSRPNQIRSKSKILYYIAVAAGYLGFILDVFYNVTIGTVLFLQLPKDVTLSLRLKRIRKEKQQGWRRKLADTICDHVLNPHDPTGYHC